MQCVNKNLRVLFWNVRSFEARKEEIEKKITNFDILILVESWLKEDEISRKTKTRPFFTGFKTFRKDRNYGDRGGGILIFIWDNIAYNELTQLNSPHQFVEICGFKITNFLPNFSIIVCYRAKGNLTQGQWDELVNHIKLDENSILVGDFNSHNTN